ncbi:MAG: hypothetical protein KF726_17085 [Anaerolineae bacterium]|nr:hypothetical protein [Anaerolineae bacterium]
MKLLSVWASNREFFDDMGIDQIIGIPGHGKLGDGNATSIELRAYLDLVSTDAIKRYVNECINSKFDGNGFALQDIVNQIGKRLDFVVENGLYRGRTNAIGFDGLWKSPNNWDIVVEIKTTDTYRFDLDNIAEYRTKLISAGQIDSQRSSILIVVGREETGGLEAQIRGSKHAWDMRLISAEALVRLMQIKDSVEKSEIADLIREILQPREFTRLDAIIDLVFSTTKDVAEGIEPSPKDVLAIDEFSEVEVEQVEKIAPANFHDVCVERVASNLEVTFTKQSRTTHRANERDLAISCSVSKEYLRGGRPSYWFAFHPSQKERLEQAADAYAVFGCGSADNILIFPLDTLTSWLPQLLFTSREDRSMYWHVFLTVANGKWYLVPRAEHGHIDITNYLLPNH